MPLIPRADLRSFNLVGKKYARLTTIAYGPFPLVSTRVNSSYAIRIQFSLVCHWKCKSFLMCHEDFKFSILSSPLNSENNYHVTAFALVILDNMDWTGESLRFYPSLDWQHEQHEPTNKKLKSLAPSYWHHNFLCIWYVLNGMPKQFGQAHLCLPF